MSTSPCALEASLITRIIHLTEARCFLEMRFEIFGSWCENLEMVSLFRVLTAMLTHGKFNFPKLRYIFCRTSKLYAERHEIGSIHASSPRKLDQLSSNISTKKINLIHRIDNRSPSSLRNLLDRKNLYLTLPTFIIGMHIY